jgi:hypothetical protein
MEQHFPKHAGRLWFADNKPEHCDHGDILIDDSDDNLKAWAAAGGIDIKFLRPWNVGSDHDLVRGIIGCLLDVNHPLAYVKHCLEDIYDTEEESFTIESEYPELDHSFLNGQTVTNEQGGKQAYVPYRLDLIPPENLLLLGECLSFGANKYGEFNWHNISLKENLNHMLGHIVQFLAGDESEPHLVNALARGNFALWQAIQEGKQPRHYYHPDLEKV